MSDVSLVSIKWYLKTFQELDFCAYLLKDWRRKVGEGTSESAWAGGIQV